jgi:hypothetical protein
MNTYSISVRLRRTVVEERYVSVPVTEAVLQDQPDEDGSLRLDGQKVFEEALRLGADEQDWLPEDRTVEVHPIQQPPPGVGQA